MFVHLTVDELARRLDEIFLRRVADGERFLVYLDGEPAAYILGPDDPLRQLVGAEPDVTDDSP